MSADPINFLYPKNHPEGDSSWRQEKPQKRTKKTLFFIILISILVIGGCITRYSISKYQPEDPAKYDQATLQPKKPEGFFKQIGYLFFGTDNSLQGYSNDRINILLLGMGGAGHDGPYLTDTIILASIKPSTGQIALISIPRDLGVEVVGFGMDKINHINSYAESKNPGEGGEAARTTVENLFDIDIPYYFRLDFKAFSEIIDEMGGVSINVETGFVDQMYPTDNYDYQTISFNKGIQTMSGETALKFVRSRHGNNGEGSDFARAHRQQKILFALKEKLLSYSTLLNPFKINDIKNSLKNHITTNLSFANIMSLASLTKSLDTKTIDTVVLDDSPNGYLQSYINNTTGAFLLRPKTGNFDEINKLVANVFSETAAAKKDDTPVQSKPIIENAIVEIQNGTWNAGLAARMKKRLEDKSFIITTIGNTTERPQTYSGIYQINNSKDLTSLKQALQQELHIPVKQNLPLGISPAPDTEILVLLGEDMQE